MPPTHASPRASGRCRTLALLLAALVAAVVGGCVYVGAERDLTTARRVVVVRAAPAVRGLLEAVESQYERAHPDIDLELDFGQDNPALDASASILADVNRGLATDLLIVEDARQLELLWRPASDRRGWLSNRLVLVAHGSSGLRNRDVVEGSCEIALVLGSAPLGMFADLALQHAGALGSVGDRIGRFSSASAVLERLRWRGVDAGPHAGASDSLGVVYASDVQATKRSSPRAAIRELAELELPPGRRIEHTLASFSDDGRQLADWLLEGGTLVLARRMGFGPPAEQPPQRVTTRALGDAPR